MTEPTRRTFLETVAAATTLAPAAQQLLGSEQSAPPPEQSAPNNLKLVPGDVMDMVLGPDEAKRLLINKIDTVVFDNQDVIEDIKKRFNMKSIWFKKIPFVGSIAQDAAHIQIKHAVDEFRNIKALQQGKQPWDNETTINEPMTLRNILKRYQNRMSRYYHEKDASDICGYENTDAKFIQTIEKVMGKTIHQLRGGYGDWKTRPIHTLPTLDFNHICSELHIPQLFHYTTQEVLDVKSKNKSR